MDETDLQGLVQGPGEFVAGLGLGMRSLVGHTIGGAAGAAGRITGTVGKGLAALTMDKDYQRRRQMQINRKPRNAGEGLAQGVRGLGAGLYDGVTGVIVRPVQGAREAGAGGFFKGVGQGLVGVVARPVGGLVDMTSATIGAVKTLAQLLSIFASFHSCADTRAEVHRLRPARYIHPDKIVRPYSLPAADGYRMLVEAAKGLYAQSDLYIAHAPILSGGNDFLFATDQ